MRACARAYAQQIQVERWVPAEERRRKEQEAALLAAQARGGDDAGERGLAQMMGGTLQVSAWAHG